MEKSSPLMCLASERERKRERKRKREQNPYIKTLKETNHFDSLHKTSILQEHCDFSNLQDKHIHTEHSKGASLLVPGKEVNSNSQSKTSVRTSKANKTSGTVST